MSEGEEKSVTICPGCKSDLVIPTVWWKRTGESDWACHACGNEWTEETVMEFKPIVREFVTLLTCMSVEGGPEGCCGCFNGIERGGDPWKFGGIEFYCNECSRVAFAAALRKSRMVER